jgi:L-ascorbate metabolism protein UlaG (beta-lactamase superfamily)
VVEPRRRREVVGCQGMNRPMSDEPVYLKPNVVVEPLVDQWYAWTHLIPPATAAMNIANRHLRIMESYLNSPSVHRAAAKNPAMAGGPFIDYDDERVDDVAALIERTRRDRGDLLRLAEAIEQLDELLRREADGSSLEPLYSRVPDLLKGYVELVYDLNSQPSFRIIEALLYHSRFYDPSAQSLVLSVIAQDARPFVLSTPRLPRHDELQLHIPFASKALDELFQAKRHPATITRLWRALGCDGPPDPRFANCFTPRIPPPYEAYHGKGIRWRYFGHACILVETQDVSILLDPVLSYTYEADISRYTYEDLPDRIDYALITHNHQDHILIETILQLRHKVKHFVVPRNGAGALQDPSMKQLLQSVGFGDVLELDELESIPILAGAITGLPFLGEHADLNVRTKLGWLIALKNQKFLFAADSCNVEPRVFKHIHDIVGDVDVLFLGMECDGAPLSWIYGALLTKPIERKKDQTRRLAGSNFERGMAIVGELNCREVYVYAMGMEPWLNHVLRTRYTDKSNPIVESGRLVEECNRRGIKSDRLFGKREVILD